MMVKTITITDEVYRKLASIKRKGESFSELFERPLESSNSVKILAELRGCIEFTEGEKERILSEIEALRAERGCL
jgi:predicted CopG family antitoxin